MGKLEFDNLQSEKGYKPWAAYGQSKLANLLFMRQLNVYFAREQIDALAVAAHPRLHGDESEFASKHLKLSQPLSCPKAPKWAHSRRFTPRPQRTFSRTTTTVRMGFQEARGYPEKVSMSADRAEQRLSRATLARIRKADGG